MIAASTAELTIRMMVSLALIGAVSLGALKLFRGRVGPGSARAGIAVESRHQLTRTASVAVIRAGGRYFLVGVSDQSVSLLAEGDDLVNRQQEPEPDAQLPVTAADGGAEGDAGRRRHRANGSVPSGMSVIEALREKTVRRS